MKIRKNTKLLVVAVVVGIILSILLYDAPGPNVKFTNESKVQVEIFEGEITSMTVNVENFENEVVEGIKVVTTLDNPDSNFIEIMNPEIEIGTLEVEDKSGSKKIEFRTFQSAGDKITFYGKSQVVIGNHTTSVIPIEITIKPLT